MHSGAKNTVARAAAAAPFRRQTVGGGV